MNGKNEDRNVSQSTELPSEYRGDATTQDATPREHGSTIPAKLDELLPYHSEALEVRGLDIEVTLSMGIVSAALGHDDGFIAIPFFVDGQIVNHKYRRVRKADRGINFCQDKDARQCVWNRDVVTDPTLSGMPLVITEGEFDALAAIQSGFVKTVSAPNGANMPTGVEDNWVTDLLDCLGPKDLIIIAADQDKPGQQFLQDLAIRLGKGRCKYVSYPRGCKDLNDVLLGYGQAEVAKSISNARFMHVTGVFRMSELPPVPTPVPYKSGMLGLDDHYKIRRGDFTVITGIPGSGKTTWVNDLCCRMAWQHGWVVTFASFEQHPQLDHRRALRTWHGKYPVNQLSHEQVQRADTWIDRQFAFVVPGDDEDATLEWVLERCASTVARYGSKLIVIDPWNEMDHAKPNGMPMTEYVGTAIRSLKRFARRFDVHLIVVAHPTKMAKNKDGTIPVPTLYDISDSANWANKADVGVVVHRGDARNTTVRIVKVRYEDQIGKRGEIIYNFNSYMGRFELVEEAH